MTSLHFTPFPVSAFLFPIPFRPIREDVDHFHNRYEEATKKVLELLQDELHLAEESGKCCPYTDPSQKKEWNNLEVMEKKTESLRRQALHLLRATDRSQDPEGMSEFSDQLQPLYEQVEKRYQQYQRQYHRLIERQQVEEECRIQKEMASLLEDAFERVITRYEQQRKTRSPDSTSRRPVGSVPFGAFRGWEVTPAKKSSDESKKHSSLSPEEHRIWEPAEIVLRPKPMKLRKTGTTLEIH